MLTFLTAYDVHFGQLGCLYKLNNIAFVCYNCYLLQNGLIVSSQNLKS